MANLLALSGFLPRIGYSRAAPALREHQHYKNQRGGFAARERRGVSAQCDGTAKKTEATRFRRVVILPRGLTALAKCERPRNRCCGRATAIHQAARQIRRTARTGLTTPLPILLAQALGSSCAGLAASFSGFGSSFGSSFTSSFFSSSFGGLGRRLSTE